MSIENNKRHKKVTLHQQNQKLEQNEQFNTEGNNIGQRHVVSKYQFSDSHISSIKNQNNCNRPPLPKKPKKFVKVLKHHYVCDQRRENHLNAKFLKKKEKLQIITKQNKSIYKRLNSQKSVYSHESLNKSYESNRSLFNSRITNRSNKSVNKSHREKFSANKSTTKEAQNKPLRIRLNSAKILNNKNQNQNLQIGINVRNINHTSNQDLKQFTCLFRISQQPKPSHIPKIRSKSAKNIISIEQNQGRSSSVLRLRPLIQTKINQIVINQQNQIQFIQQKGIKFQGKTQQNSKFGQNQSHIRKKSNSATMRYKNINLFQIKDKNMIIKHQISKNLQKKLNDQYDQQNFRPQKQNKFSQIKISKRYSGLMTKIANQLNKIKKIQPRLMQISGKGRTNLKTGKTFLF